MSRQELADAASVHLAHPITGHYIAKLERGELRWPSKETRAAIRRVLNADQDHELGFYVVRRTGTTARARTVDRAGESVALPTALGPQEDHRPTAATDVDELLTHLSDQWHALVKADNLLGPRHALVGVLHYLGVIETIMPSLRGQLRTTAVGLGSRYAESAAWLYEDSGDVASAEAWAVRAMSWAHEVGDAAMLAWTAYRRSQQAAAKADVGAGQGLAATAQRWADAFDPGPMRAAARVQGALCLAMDRDRTAALRLIDEAQRYATSDDAGDARTGHGSFCTESYIEIQRGRCLALVGSHEEALASYEHGIKRLPVVYRRDWASAMALHAVSLSHTGNQQSAASVAHQALPVARRSGSKRIVAELMALGRQLAATGTTDDVVATFVADLQADS